MSRRRGRRRSRRSRAVTFPPCPPSDTHADLSDRRQRLLKAAMVTALVLVAVTSIAAVTIVVQSNTDVVKTATNLPPYQGDYKAGIADSKDLSRHNRRDRVQVKRDSVEDNTQAHRVPDSMIPADAPPTTDPSSMTPPTGHVKNPQVPDQTETVRSEGWKRFRVERIPTCDAYNHTQVPTVPPHVGDEERYGFGDWDYTTKDNHYSNVRVRHRVSKISLNSETFSATNESPTDKMTQLESKPNSSLDKKGNGDIDNTGTAAMDNVKMKNSTDLNLYLNAMLTDSMKMHNRKHRVLKRIRRAKVIALAVAGVLIAGLVGYNCLG
ncbi:Hypp195 [Branchiostoma lanceolatum]|uniref:Hypp195 protein n=1 Tax=Branchiostoma lanceolatum TaxID=7740 RepID=A0A8J9YPQ0_BRALA|nr:Hypp195 [Branchiostoma lanceolatum]